MIASGMKVMLTNITIEELDAMKKFKDNDGYAARQLLEKAAQTPNTFIYEKIPKISDNPDDSIINYCVQNKETIILYTADNAMAVKARLEGVKTEYFNRNEKSFKKHSTGTIYQARKVGNELFIPQLKTAYRHIKVISKSGITHTDGKCILNPGDNVYIATKKTQGYVSFVHYIITANSTNDHCKLVCSKRIYSENDIKKLDENYKMFIVDFMETLK